MYNEQLENLIEMALMDGELSDKEKQVLFKKAQEHGIDLDEFEMVLDARLFAKNKADASAAAPPPPQPTAPQQTSQTKKHGDINKCPSCGSPVPSMASKCGDCGHDFSNISVASSVQKLHDDLQKADEEERNRKRPGAGSWIDKIDQGASGNQQMEERILKRKASIVSSFPVPNSKEDILEFLAMAVPEAGKKPNFFERLTARGTYYKTWVGKAEQIVIKARFAMKEDKATLEQIEYYAKQLEIKK
jgi:hypothetical protein